MSTNELDLDKTKVSLGWPITIAVVLGGMIFTFVGTKVMAHDAELNRQDKRLTRVEDAVEVLKEIHQELRLMRTKKDD